MYIRIIFTFLSPSNIPNFQVAYFMKWTLKTLSLLQYLEVTDMHRISASIRNFERQHCRN